MSNFDNSDVELAEGTLKVDVDSMTSEQQFNQWMTIKGVEKEARDNCNVVVNVTSNILIQLIQKNSPTGVPQEHTQICFDRAEHDKSEGGYDKETFDRACGGFDNN